MKSKFKLNTIINIIIFLLTSASFFSIPALSFRTKYYIITWVLIIFLIISMILYIFLSRRLVFDIVSASFLLFAFSSIISSALSGFRAFKITAPALSLLSLIVYTYCKSSPNNANKFLYGVFLGDVCFLLLFIFHYRTELIKLNFSRLGDYFGDINDISLFMSVGLVFCFFFIFFHKKIIVKIIGAFTGFLFFVCGLTSGSKIFVFSFIFVTIFAVFLFFGKKKWWLSIIILAVLFGLFILLLQLPSLSTIRKRIVDFTFTMTGNSSDKTATVDLSTVDRMNMFVAGMEMFFRKPFFGWGIWGFATFGGVNNGWSHNNFSESLCNFGIIGTILFHFPFFISIKNFVKRKQKAYILPFLLIVFFVVSMFSVALNSEKVYALIAPASFAILCSREKEILSSFTKKINNRKVLMYENC